MTPPVVPPLLWLRRALPVGGLALILGACVSASAQGREPSTLSPPAERLAAQEHPASQNKDGATLQVSGQAQLSVPADRVKISFAVETEAPNAQDAVRENAERMEGVMAALRGSGVEGLEIETFGYNLFPDYRYPPRAEGQVREIAGYRAQNNIRVTVPEVESAGEILDAATAAGANRVQSLQFEASDIPLVPPVQLDDLLFSDLPLLQMGADAQGHVERGRLWRQVNGGLVVQVIVVVVGDDHRVESRQVFDGYRYRMKPLGPHERER